MGGDHNVRKAKERMVPAKKDRSEAEATSGSVVDNNDYERDH